MYRCVRTVVIALRAENRALTVIRTIEQERDSSVSWLVSIKTQASNLTAYIIIQEWEEDQAAIMEDESERHRREEQERRAKRKVSASDV